VNQFGVKAYGCTERNTLLGNVCIFTNMSDYELFFLLRGSKLIGYTQ